MDSTTLKEFFLFILKAGNYMNYGSFMGGAYGFDISSLTKVHVVACLVNIIVMRILAIFCGCKFVEFLFCHLFVVRKL